MKSYQKYYNISSIDSDPSSWFIISIHSVSHLNFILLLDELNLVALIGNERLVSRVSELEGCDHDEDEHNWAPYGGLGEQRHEDQVNLRECAH